MPPWRTILVAAAKEPHQFSALDPNMRNKGQIFDSSALLMVLTGVIISAGASIIMSEGPAGCHHASMSSNLTYPFKEPETELQAGKLNLPSRTKFCDLSRECPAEFAEPNTSLATLVPRSSQTDWPSAAALILNRSHTSFFNFMVTMVFIVRVSRVTVIV